MSGELTPDDVKHWDLSVIHQIFETAAKRRDSKHQLGEALSNAEARTRDWQGESGDAFREELGRDRADVNEAGRESDRVFKAVRNAEMWVSGAKVELDDVESAAEAYGWKVTSDWKIDGGDNNINWVYDPVVLAEEQQRLQEELDKAHTDAQIADRDLAAAVRASVGDAELDERGHEVPPAPPKPDEGKTTPADKLPLPTKGHPPSPTEATRDNSSPDVSRHLGDNPHPSPLLAGLSAAQWHERLSHFQPGDPLPDPRTPTGDKAIDALAYAAGQQNTTYAWGGNKSTDGPSKGQPDNGRGANQNHDWDRYGYDCGGLVRYSVEQGAGFDVGQGTDAIDSNPHFTHPATGGLPSAQAAAQAQAGDVLVFGGSDPYHGGGSDHTGIYIGNGYMMNAPESGQPVRVDKVGPGRGPTDILRLPSP